MIVTVQEKLPMIAVLAGEVVCESAKENFKQIGSSDLTNLILIWNLSMTWNLSLQTP